MENTTFFEKITKNVTNITENVTKKKSKNKQKGKHDIFPTKKNKKIPNEKCQKHPPALVPTLKTLPFVTSPATLKPHPNPHVSVLKVTESV